MDALEKERQQRRDAEAKRHEKSLAGIVAGEDAAIKELNADTDAKLAATRSELDKAREQLERAIATARERRAAVDAEKGPAAGDAGDPLSRLKNQVDDFFARVSGDLGTGGFERRIIAAGTFNAVAANALGGGVSRERQIEKNTAETAKYAKRQCEQTERNQQTFT